MAAGSVSSGDDSTSSTHRDRTASNTPRGASSTGIENRATDVPADQRSASDRGRHPGRQNDQHNQSNQ
jgi:hypothetical protein